MEHKVKGKLVSEVGGYLKEKFTLPYLLRKLISLSTDAPHVLKRARNHCVFHKGFLVPSSLNNHNLYKLGFKDFANILTENGWTQNDLGLRKMGAEDFKTSFRLTPAHLKMKGNQAQNVRKAAQTFSHTNAKSILNLTKNKGLYHAEQGQALHDAILIFNDWYVLFSFYRAALNSRPCFLLKCNELEILLPSFSITPQS
jgi:hypothetical protein